MTPCSQGAGRGPRRRPASFRPTLRLERPKREAQGDYSTNAALLLAPGCARAPREIAELLAPSFSASSGALLERTEVAGPGFLNLFLRTSGTGGARGYRRRRRPLRDRAAATPERILIEFVSANPTGPLVAASGRHAAYGDALARILEHFGHSVSREYYFNDAGTQIELLGDSVKARARGEEVPRGRLPGRLRRGVGGVDRWRR